MDIVVAFLLSLLRGLWCLVTGTSTSNVFGDARFMGEAEKRLFLSRRHTGLVLGPRLRLGSHESRKHMAVVAPTGVGKTTRYVIPNVLEAEGSVVITDPAGEIFEKTSGHMKERGYHVQCLRPAEPYRSLRFNPLEGRDSPQALKELATILNVNVLGRSSEPFWGLNAQNLLQIALEALVQVEDEAYVNLGNLRWVLNHIGDKKALDYFMSRYLTSEQMFAEYMAFSCQDPKVIASTLSTARAALDLWSDPEICRLTATDSVHIDRMRKEPTAIYIIVPEHRIQYFGILINLFYHACFSHCLETFSDGLLPVSFFLDEFGNLGYIPGFSTLITTLRKRGCSISIILQELSQLQATYGRDEAATIFGGGCGNKLFFSGLDLETTRYIEDILGRTTEIDRPPGGREDQARTVGVPLMTADEIRMLGRSESILISGNRRPIKLEMPPFEKVPSWHRLTEKQPYDEPFDYSREEVKFLHLKENYQLV